jgi:hypothetical protein
MTYGAEGGAAAAIAAAIANAVKASGAIVRVEPPDFVTIVSRAEKPLVVINYGGWPRKKYQYLSAYKGLIFYTKSVTPVLLPGGAETIAAKRIWIPD